MFAVIGTQYFKELNYLLSVLAEERVQCKKPKISLLQYDQFFAWGNNI